MNKQLKVILKNYSDKLGFLGMKYMVDKIGDIEYEMGKQSIVEELYIKIQSLEPKYESQVI